ncbi:MAG: hypothetical protein ABIG30_00850 [Candidatus Aenigmatarchaeota archaeon]
MQFYKPVLAALLSALILAGCGGKDKNDYRTLRYIDTDGNKKYDTLSIEFHTAKINPETGELISDEIIATERSRLQKELTEEEIRKHIKMPSGGFIFDKTPSSKE